MRIVTGVAIAAALAGLPVAVAAEPVGGGGRIAFASDRRPNLTHDARLSFAPVAGAHPRVVEIGRGLQLDPSGRLVAYGASEPAGREVLVVAARDGSGARAVARNLWPVGRPVWSPDGRSIAYELFDVSPCGPADHGCANIQLWIARTDGSRARKVTDHGRYPVWSPDSRHIAFVGGYSAYEDAGRLWTARGDGTGARRLSGRYRVTHYAWSPRSDRIAFSDHARLHVVSLRGGRAKPIGFGGPSAWSPDGSRLAVARGSRAGAALWIVTARGRTLRRVGRGQWISEVAWSRAGIAYLSVSNQAGGSTALRVVAADGHGARTIATLDRRTRLDGLRWSGGRVLVRASAGESDSDLFTMAVDGSDVRRLTDDADIETQPSWAPDGRRLVYPSFTPMPNASSSLWVIDATSGAPATRITTPPPGSSDSWPAWSPAADAIAFTRDVAGTAGSHIWIVRADGSGAALLTTQVEGENSHPTWSPDGRRIAFAHAAQGRGAIWVMNADGGELRELTSVVGSPAPAWSPNGSRLAAVGNGRVVTFRLDGTDLRTIADDADGFGPPRWSPDGRWLAYESGDDIHAVSLDGATTLDLTASPEPEQDPDWSRSGG